MGLVFCVDFGRMVVSGGGSGLRMAGRRGDPGALLSRFV